MAAETSASCRETLMNRMPELESIFAEAVRLQDPAQQRDFLDSRCNQDTLLRNRVGALIEANRRAASFMSEPAGLFDLQELEEYGSSDLQPIGEQPGDVIGRYKLIEQIGEGGMGTVFRAQQTEPVRRTVALKVVKPGLDTKEVIARFESERQALALMDHPHIARAYDAGATPSGRPYFVMEYVAGQSISEYCNAQRLSTRERLELFLPICDAIQHAHHKGVIHRDIKPQNVLVTTDAAKPQPKVIDFGIAKATDQRLTDKTLLTRFGQFVGTPAYMSPEQADSTVSDIDTRSDVYSLGATLYELLAGVAPFDVAKLKTKPSEEICRVIREETPLQPSAAISTNRDAAATAVALARRATPDELKSTIRGDLDWIVMRALEKDRERRYATVAALADDVRRHLNHVEVIARPPTWGYRLQKFVARNRLLVATAATVLATLLLATVVSCGFAVWAMQSLSLATRQADIASQEKATLQDYVGFLNNEVFAQANPVEEPNRDVKLRFVLDRAAQRLSTQVPLRPDVEAAVRVTLGETYRGLGDYQQSLTHLQRAHDLYEERFGPNDLRTATCGNELASTLLALAEFEEAKLQLDQAMIVAEQQQDSELRLATMQLMAAHHQAMGELQAAEAILSRVLDARKRGLGEDNRRTYQAMADLAYVLQEQGRHADALTLLGNAYQGLQIDDLHPSTLRAAVRLARLHTLQGNIDQAAVLYEQTVNDLARLLGESHPQTVTAKHGWALLKSSLHEWPQAQQLLTEVLDAQRKQLGNEHPATLATMHNLAKLHARIGNAEAARSLYEEELRGQLQTHGPSHNATREAISSMAFFLMEQGKFSDAIPFYVQLVDSFSSDHVLIDDRLVTSRSMLGLCHAKTGNHAAAKQVLELALSDCRNSFPESWIRAIVEGQLGEVYHRLGQQDAAETALVNSYEMLQQLETDLPTRWRPLGLRAATRRLADFYASSTSSQQQALAQEYRAEYQRICEFGFQQNDEHAENIGDGSTN